MKNSNKQRIEVSLDVHCADDISCDMPLKVKLTGLVIFLLVLFFII